MIRFVCSVMLLLFSSQLAVGQSSELLKSYGDCKQRLQKINDKIAALNHEYERDKTEYLQGLFCSDCNRSKSQIEKEDHISFSAHIAKGADHGRKEIHVTQAQLDDLHKKYLDKWNSLDDDYKSTTKECGDLNTDYNKAKMSELTEASKKQQEQQKKPQKQQKEPTMPVNTPPQPVADMTPPSQPYTTNDYYPPEPIIPERNYAAEEVENGIVKYQDAYGDIKVDAKMTGSENTQAVREIAGDKISGGTYDEMPLANNMLPESFLSSAPSIIGNLNEGTVYSADAVPGTGTKDKLLSLFGHSNTNNDNPDHFIGSQSDKNLDDLIKHSNVDEDTKKDLGNIKNFAGNQLDNVKDAIGPNATPEDEKRLEDNFARGLKLPAKLTKGYDLPTVDKIIDYAKSHPASSLAIGAGIVLEAPAFIVIGLLTLKLPQ